MNVTLCAAVLKKDSLEIERMINEIENLRSLALVDDAKRPLIKAPILDCLKELVYLKYRIDGLVRAMGADSEVSNG